jgi:hypothetical protein
MILHSLFSKFTLTALVGVLFPGRLALAVSNLQTPIEIPNLHSNDLAFHRQVTTGMSMVFDSAPEKYAKYFPRGRFHTSHPSLDETWFDCLFDASCTTIPAVAATCQKSQQDLTHFHDDMELLAQYGWGAHIWQDSVLNYPQRIARMHTAQLEISKAASLIAGMDDRALEEHLPALTEFCKALRDKAMGSSKSCRGYTVSQWVADHVDKWTVW